MRTCHVARRILQRRYEGREQVLRILAQAEAAVTASDVWAFADGLTLPQVAAHLRECRRYGYVEPAYGRGRAKTRYKITSQGRHALQRS